MRPFVRFFCYFFVSTCTSLGIQDRRVAETKSPTLSQAYHPSAPIKHFVQDEPPKIKVNNLVEKTQREEAQARSSIKEIISPQTVKKIQPLKKSTENVSADILNVEKKTTQAYVTTSTTKTSITSLTDQSVSTEPTEVSEILSNIQLNDAIDSGEIQIEARSLFSNRNRTSTNAIVKADDGKPEKKITKTDTFTKAEREALDKFRPQVINLITRDYEKTDAYLLQWLRVQNFNIEKAVERVRKTQKWRADNRVDTIVNETIFDFHPSPYLIDGYDREGRPLILFTPTSIDLRKLLVIQGVFDKAYRYGIQVLESGMAKRHEASLKFGKEITQVVVIVDLTGFNLRQHSCFSCIPVLRDWIIGFEQYYPDASKYLIAINVPRIALPFLDLVKPFVSELALKSLRVFGSNRAEWIEFLHKIISPDQLPYRFGGTKST